MKNTPDSSSGREREKCTGLSQLSERGREGGRERCGVGEREAWGGVRRSKRKREGKGLIMDAAVVTLFTHYPHLIALMARCMPSPPTSYYLLYYLSKPFPQQAADRTAESPRPNPPCSAVMQVKTHEPAAEKPESDYSSHNIHPRP